MGKVEDALFLWHARDFIVYELYDLWLHIAFYDVTECIVSTEKYTKEIKLHSCEPFHSEFDISMPNESEVVNG